MEEEGREGRGYFRSFFLPSLTFFTLSRVIAFFPSRAVALEILGFPIHWYGLLYFAAFLLAWWMIPRLQALRGLSLSRSDWERMLSYGVAGVILGGRLGFVLFYEPVYFLRHPLEIFAVWNGGMASHGGFLGVIIALLIALKDRRGDILKIADVIVVPAAIGLALGRIGNFINQELYGTVTTLAWGIAIPGVEGLRHPTALYAIIKDLTIAAVCFSHLTLARRAHPGETAAIFLMMYGVLRSIVEMFRDQPYGWVDLGIISLTPGQFLTIPVFFFGVGLWWWVRRMRR